MFDSALPEIAALGDLSAGELIDAARGWARAENQACARKLAVMAEIFARRTGLAAGDRELWWVDPEAAVAAELSAALDVGQGLATHQTHRGVALRDRLPRVAALFEAGLINDLLVRAIVWRTYLITDADAMAAVDAELAAQIAGWGTLSAAKTETAIDALVERHDPGALRRNRESAGSRDVQFGARGDSPGFTSLWARLYSADAAALRERIEQLAHSVCEADPRGVDERRNDALAALGLGLEALSCQCTSQGCDASGRERPTRDTTVYIVADQASFTQAAQIRADAKAQPAAEVRAGAEAAPTAAPEPAPTACAATPEPARATTPEPEPTPTPAEPGQPAPQAPPAFVFGAGIMPAVLLGELIDGARVREINHPGDSAPEPRYRPSAALAAFIRCRDLTCRFPGCDHPATNADIDHTVAYPIGPTHPSNLKMLCRFHHLLKTFWTGPHGWHDRQLPNGTVIWTSPTGHTYTTHPGGAVLFPALCRPTATLWTGDHPPATPTPATLTNSQRGAMMPRRRRTRAANRADTITAERRLNDAQVAERNRPPPF